jgi:hypothetical protein
MFQHICCICSLSGLLILFPLKICTSSNSWMFAPFMAIRLTTICPLCVITGTFILAIVTSPFMPTGAVPVEIAIFILLAIIKRGA